MDNKEELKEQELPAENAEEVIEQPVKKPAKKAREAKLHARVKAGYKLLNMRENPSLDAKVLVVLKDGEEFLVSKNGSTEDFYKVSKGNLVGYCMKEFIEIIEAPKSEDKEA